MSEPTRGPITISRPRSADAAAVASTMADPQVQPGLLQMPYGTEEFRRKRIDEKAVGSAVQELFPVAERDGVVVGNAGLTPTANVRRRHVMGRGSWLRAGRTGAGRG